MKETIDILIENAVVMPMDASKSLLPDGVVAIKGKDIIDVGSSVELKGKYEATRKINGKNKLVMPGLINGHTHLSGGLARGMIDDLSLTPWIQKAFYLTSKALDEENYYISTMLLCLEMLKTGTTCFADCGTVEGLEQAAVSAIEKIGMKAVLGRTVMDVADVHASSYHRGEATTEESLAKGEEFIRTWNNAADGRIQAWLCLMLVPSVSDKLCVGASELVRRNNVGILIHASVTPAEVELCVEHYGLTPVQRLYQLGALTPNLVTAHAGWITDHEMQLLKETGSSLIHVPSSSMKGAYGSLSMGKFPELVSIGVNVGLGSDGAPSSSFQDMVRVINLVAAGHKEVRLDPRIMPPDVVIEMATVNNAKALLWSDSIGSLEKGKRADMVLFDLMRPEWIPWNEKTIISNLAYAASGHSADTVIIDGEIVMEGGVVKTVNEKEILEKAQKASMKFQKLSDEWDAARPEAKK